MSDSGASSALDVIARVEAESGKPLAAMLELSDRCNEVCVHCYQVQGQKGELSTGEWRKILDQLAEAGVLMLTLSGGEVTLRKDFLEILAYARQRSFAVRLFTNGLTMTRELAAKVAAQNVVDVEISLYSPRAEVHDFVTGVPGSFAKTVQGIRFLRELGVAVTIKAVMMNINQVDLPEYPAFAAALDVHFRIDTTGLVPREGCDRAPQALNPDRAHVDQLERQLRVQKKREPEAPAQPGSGLRPASRKVCGAARTLHVEPNGEMRPCTLLEVDLGDVRSASPAAIFESDKARAVRELKWGDLHGCRVCELARRCSRCHAVALAETGDALGPHPSACAQSRVAAQAASAHAHEVRFIAQGSRPITHGPYRLIAQNVYEAFDEPKTPEDEALALRLGWVRRSDGGKRAPDLAVRPGELVQIRRPGSKSSKLERVPGVASHDHGHDHGYGHAADIRAKLSSANPSPVEPERQFADEPRRVREG